MSQPRILACAFAIVAGVSADSSVRAFDDRPETRDGLVVRLVHPDRQAARVLALFEGARFPHPAAALVAWKRATHDPNQLGKPLEAVIAFFNPDMTPEWRVMDGAQIGFDLSNADGGQRWFAVVPRDDGTLAAAITAQRLTEGSRDLPLTVEGRPIDVERLGRAGAIVAARTGASLVLGSSRDQLIRGWRRIGTASRLAPTNKTEAISQAELIPKISKTPFDSGLVVDLEPELISADVGSIAYRRAVALFHGLGCKTVHGSLGLTGELFTMEVTTVLKPDALARWRPAKPPAAVDPAWLEWIPAAGAMAVLSVAVEPAEPFWESAFALADRVERADPSRAELAPVRARFNLLAAAAGARPEVDLWPHLNGITAGMFGDPDRPGRPIGAIVVLHADTDSSANRLVTDVLPRLASLLTAHKPGLAPLPQAGPRPAGGAKLLGKIGGRRLTLSRRGRDVVLTWGDEMQKSSENAVAQPDRSVAPLCSGWSRAGKTPPQRVGAVWPARCWPASAGLDTTTSAWRALAQGPPAVWWGWNDPVTAHDSIFLGDLRLRVRRFLDELPLDPSPL